MGIKKSYFEAWNKDVKQVIKETEEEHANMSEEDRKKEEEQMERELQALHARIEELEARTVRIKKPHKKIQFKFLSRMALAYAKQDCVDIEIDTTEVHGRIQLETGQVIVDSLRKSYRKVWTRLIRFADTYWVNVVKQNDESILRFTFFYDFESKHEWKGFRK